MPFPPIQPDITSKIKFSNTSNYTQALDPGELGFNYYDNTLYIGNINPSNNPLILMAGNLANIVESYMTDIVDSTLTNKLPTASAIYKILLHKVDLHHSNKFTGMNQFPYLRISTCAPAQKDVAVTIRMLEDYLIGNGQNGSPYEKGILTDPASPIIDDIAAAVSTNLSRTVSHTYPFTNQQVFIINHNMHTGNLSYVIRDLNNDINIAPVEIIDSNNIRINLSFHMSGTVEITFYYG
jgi:hypothetical protein